MSFDIYSVVENEEIECKASVDKLSRDVWETYSAFANTNGGTVLLGIKEKNGKFSINGVNNSDDIIKDIWDNLNNSKKVSSNILVNSSIETKQIDGKTIILIQVPKADRRQRPVYIGENPFNESKGSGTFRRNYSGDYKCSKEEIKRMIADQEDESQDSHIIEGYSIEDLNCDTIKNFRTRLSALKPEHPWIGFDDKTFLYKLGAYGKDRKTKKEGITGAGLLMFGEERAITDEFPKYFLDYREKISEDIRWEYRLISSEGTWSGNLYDFYYKIINRITDNLNIPFKLINGIRQEDTRVHKAVREAIANSLIHADYKLPRGVVIEKGKTYFKFCNPGNLRITRDEALRGGISDPRNENIFKMFNLLGIGERAGSGLENIHLAWKEQNWIVPDLEETYDPDRISLTLRTISILPKESIDLLKKELKDNFDTLSNDEVMALVAAHQEGYVTNNRLQQLLDTHSLITKKILSNLVEKSLLESDGIGKGTKYYLVVRFKNNNKIKENDRIYESENTAIESKLSIYSGLNENERLLINYIVNNEYINNTISRDQLGLTKSASINAFNNLIKKGIIEKIGASSSTKYILKTNNL